MEQSHSQPRKKRRVICPLDEEAKAVDLTTFKARNRLTSWAALDAEGNLVPELSHRPHLRQDPASTTKLWTVYTVLTMMRDGLLPDNFIDQHRHLVDRMMIASNNIAAKKLANAADSHHSKIHFCHRMTELAHAQGLTNSHFNAPDGWLQEGNYSTAADMARISYLFARDFPEYTYLASQLSAEGVTRLNTGAKLFSSGVLFGKTGTGMGVYGGNGKFHYTGAVESGFVAVSSATTKQERNSVVIGALEGLSGKPMPVLAPISDDQRWVSRMALIKGLNPELHGPIPAFDAPARER